MQSLTDFARGVDAYGQPRLLLQQQQQQQPQQQRLIGADEANAVFGGAGDFQPISLWSAATLVKVLLLIAAIVLGVLCLVFILKAIKNVDDVDDKLDALDEEINAIDEELDTLMHTSDYVRPCHDCCTPVLELPLVVQSQRCYDLMADFYIANSSSAIVFTNVYDVQVNFLNHSITVNGSAGTTAISITNSSRVQLNTPRLFSVPESAHTSSFGIRIEPVFNAPLSLSDDIWIRDAWISGFRRGIFAQRADVHVINANIRAVRNDTTARIGILAQNVRSLEVLGGHINITAITPVFFDNGPVGRNFGIIANVFTVPGSATTVDDLRTSSVRIENAFIYSSSCIRLKGSLAILRNNRIYMDRKAAISVAVEIGESPPTKSMLLEGNTVDCEVPSDVDGTGEGNSCILLSNVRSAILRDNTIVGRLAPWPGVYRGALLEFDVQGDPSYHDAFGGNFGFLHQDAILVEGGSITATDSDTLAVHVRGDFTPSLKSTTLRNMVISGGLVGVLLRNFSDGVTLDNVQISGASYCVAATESVRGVVVKNSDVFRCCIGYYADDTTAAIVLLHNTAISCVTAYSDSGTGNEFSTGAGTEGENREYGTNGECEPPSLACIVEGTCLLKRSVRSASMSAVVPPIHQMHRRWDDEDCVGCT